MERHAVLHSRGVQQRLHATTAAGLLVLIVATLAMGLNSVNTNLEKAIMGGIRLVRGSTAPVTIVITEILMRLMKKVEFISAKGLQRKFFTRHVTISPQLL